MLLLLDNCKAHPKFKNTFTILQAMKHILELRILKILQSGENGKSVNNQKF